MPLVTINSSIQESLKKHEIVPDVIDDGFNPSCLLTISYTKEIGVSMGNNLKPSETKNIPDVFVATDYTPSEKSNASSSNSEPKYTLVLTDPDAPSRTEKKWSEFCHYIVTGLTIPTDPKSGVSLGKLDISKGSTLMPYCGPAPPPKTGKHRYVFLLYKEPQVSHGVLMKPPRDRPTWGTDVPASGVRDWAKKYNLELAGVNFFYAQNDEQ
ncbi:phosphatidylethanolamine-binding protein [Nadsonia fulvescens var. elongata DSM 6958]|uniref:Phosphatidylethanolamine-binding protein n=1 Tax=Nadsonia fulvescens var. elongata DSM 6958 TaxID=857566 RepID=A0A1E3PL27_9ASCO|nr:phosphatidylethanolamine-binding protein [Nadsonia fulvescens var. elongata DSM 6958]